MIENLHHDNFLIYSIKAYDKPNALQSEFEEDIARLLYIKRLLSKYYKTGDLKERLLLNHLVIFCNVFGIIPATRLLFLKLDSKDWTVIKPFLLYLNCLPEAIVNVRGKTVMTADISLDEKAIAALRALK